MKLIQKRLEDIAEIIAGQSPPSSTYNKDGTGIPFFQGMADYGERNPVIRYWCSSPTKISLPNDVLISVRAPVGPVVINNVKACIGRGLSAIRVKENANQEFVFYFLKSNLRAIENMGVGSTFKAITQKDLKELLIPLPPLPDQIRIAEILSKAETLIAERKKSISLLDELIKSTFLEMFGDPVLEKVESSVRLEDIASVVSGLTKGKKYENKETFFVPYMRVANVQEGHLNLSEIKEIAATRDEIARYQLADGDLLLTEGGDPDKLG